ncbi:hypothetical protein GCM10023324_18110 [Streptomyces youssoufiensis]
MVAAEYLMGPLNADETGCDSACAFDRGGVVKLYEQCVHLTAGCPTLSEHSAVRFLDGAGRVNRRPGWSFVHDVVPLP